MAISVEGQAMCRYHDQGYFYLKENLSCKFLFDSPDTKDNFIRNLAERPAEWTNFFQNYKMRYMHNNMGHRNDVELTGIVDQPYGVAFGCSYTYGTGLAAQDVYHRLVSEQLGYPIYNFGIPGGNDETSINNLIWLLSTHPVPEFIIFQQTFSQRCTNICPQGSREPDMYGPWFPKLDKVLEYLVYREELGIGESNKCLIAQQVRNLCKRIPHVIFDATTLIPHILIDRARDWVHAGIKTHMNIADGILNQKNYLINQPLYK